MYTVEVDGSRTVLIDFGNDTVQVVGCQLVVQFVKDFSQSGGGDVSVACCVVHQRRVQSLRSILVMFLCAANGKLFSNSLTFFVVKTESFL